MEYLPVALVIVVAVELFLRLSAVRIAGELPVILKKATRVVTSRAISDHWKEKVLLRYSSMIALISLKIAAIICVVGAAVVLLSLLFDRVLTLQQSMLNILATWFGLAVAMVVSVAYVKVRPRLVSD